MKSADLKWCPTDCLTEWAHAHFYYLPESISEGKAETWTATMQSLIAELDERGFSVELRSNKKKD